MQTLICPRCHVVLRPSKIGVPVELMTGDGPYKLFMADRFACPGCGLEVIAGLGPAPLAEHYQPHYESMVASMKQSEGELTQYWSTIKEQTQYRAAGSPRPVRLEVKSDV